MTNVPSLIRALSGETLKTPPVWFMRQAGRSLPEYRALREQAKDFVAFCLDPVMAAEATLQPMRRFPLDAAIVFADILLIPLALGQAVGFEPGEGPQLGEMPSFKTMEARIDTVAAKLSAVGETLQRVRSELEPERALIGFAGAPWTVATYMLERKGGDRAKVRGLAYAEIEQVDRLIDVLVEATARYLVMQAEAGAQALKLFESWAEHLPEDQFHRLVVGPHARIVERVRQLGVTVPIIGFPRGAGSLVEATARYLVMQAEAGAQALKLFESWAEHLPEDQFHRLVVRPHARIVERVRQLGVTVPIIGFPRGAGSLVEVYADAVEVQGVALDETASAAFGRRIQQKRTIQGALDNLLLRAGGPQLDRRIDELKAAWGGGPWIFNLGHGVMPDTPIAHIEQALARIKSA